MSRFLGFASHPDNKPQSVWPYDRVAAIQRMANRDREIILDLREKLARAEQERDAALFLIESMQRENLKG